MMRKGYTAAEMREMADFFDRNAEMVRRKVLSNAILANIHEVIPMLRQAANAMEQEGNKCGDCDKFVSKEVSALRALVKELSDSLDASCDCHCRCDGCDMADESKFDCPDKAWRALVARARETIGGAK